MEMTVLIWILTYALHSAVLIGAVWLLTWAAPKLAARTHVLLWKVALVGGLLTATIHVGAGIDPPWGNVSLPPFLDSDPQAYQVVDFEVQGAETVVSQHIVERDGVRVTTTERMPGVASVPVLQPASQSQRGGSPWPWVLLAVVGLSALAALGRLVWLAVRFARQLKARREVIEDPALESFIQLCNAAEIPKKRLRLTTTPDLATPVVLWREIVIPERAIAALAPAQHQGVVAQSIGHVIQRNAAWAAGSSVLEALFFFQPLNIVARRKLVDAMSRHADAWASSKLGTGVHTARALAEVSAWGKRGPGLPPFALSFTSGEVVSRMSRLLEAPRSPGAMEPSVPGHAMQLAGVGAVIGLATWLVPGVEREIAIVDATATTMPASTAPTSLDDNLVVEQVRDAAGRKHARVVVEQGHRRVEVDVEQPRDGSLPRLPKPQPRPECDHRGGFEFRIEWRMGARIKEPCHRRPPREERKRARHEPEVNPFEI